VFLGSRVFRPIVYMGTRGPLLACDWRTGRGDNAVSLATMFVVHITGKVMTEKKIVFLSNQDSRSFRTELAWLHVILQSCGVSMQGW
jgi:hypothetical protein